MCAGHVSASEERVMVSQEELQDLKGVWAELSKIWQQIDELKERPWMSVQPRKVCNCTTVVYCSDVISDVVIVCDLIHNIDETVLF